MLCYMNQYMEQSMKKNNVEDWYNMADEEMIKFSEKLEDEIQWLNENKIKGNQNELSKETAMDVRDCLIEAQNRINRYRLTHIKMW